METPVSTYRLQFNKTFTLDDAAHIIPFLSDLGVTTAYGSPILKAAPGSMHGYDICDTHKSIRKLVERTHWHACLRSCNPAVWA